MPSIRNILTLGILCAMAPAVSAQQSCEGLGDVEFVCGPRNAEDLVLVPGTRWIIASGMAAGAGFYLIDSDSGDWSALQTRERPDAVAYPNCPSAPTVAALETHGLNIRAGSGGRSPTPTQPRSCELRGSCRSHPITCIWPRMAGYTRPG